MNRQPVFVGIDVSKAHLDVAFSDQEEVQRLGNDEAGIEGLVGLIQPLNPPLVVLEATGGFEVAPAAALAAAGVPVVIANPRNTRDFAKSTGQLAKTDAIDARGLALFFRPGCGPRFEGFLRRRRGSWTHSSVADGSSFR